MRFGDRKFRTGKNVWDTATVGSVHIVVTHIATPTREARRQERIRTVIGDLRPHDHTLARRGSIDALCLKRQKSVKNMKCEDFFYGSATVGERGQIVIPAEARTELGINPGDKLLIMKDPVHEGLVMCKFEVLTGFFDEFKRKLTELVEQDNANQAKEKSE